MRPHESLVQGWRGSLFSEGSSVTTVVSAVVGVLAFSCQVDKPFGPYKVDPLKTSPGPRLVWGWGCRVSKTNWRVGMR